MDRKLFELNAQIEDHHWWFCARRAILVDVIRRLLPSGTGSRVLDIGCGTGGNLAALAEHFDCTGIDPTEVAIEFARERFPRIEFIRGFAPGDIMDLMPTFDLILMTDVLEHVEYDITMFSEIVSAAKPGAHFVLTVPADQRLWSEHDVSHGHFRRYAPDRFEQIWEDLPVDKLFTSHFNWRLYPIIRTIRALGQLRGTSAGEHGSDLSVPNSLVNKTLYKIFAGESPRLIQGLENQSGPISTFGVSLLGVLQKQRSSVIRKAA
jgi:SAM-dependent methyltransferase